MIFVILERVKFKLFVMLFCHNEILLQHSSVASCLSIFGFLIFASISYIIAPRQGYDMLNGLFAKLPDNATSIFHSDQGCQYQHSEYQNLLSEHNITQSMLRKGNYLKEYIYYYNNERIVSKLKMSPVKYRTNSLAS